RTDDGVEVHAGRPRPQQWRVVVAFGDVAGWLLRVVLFDEVVRDGGFLVPRVVPAEDLDIMPLFVLVRRLGSAIVGELDLHGVPAGRGVLDRVTDRQVEVPRLRIAPGDLKRLVDLHDAQVDNERRGTGVLFFERPVLIVKRDLLRIP